MRVAIMQPYLYPYMNYFRLIARVDLFVLLDTVQFPRRGRVHRAELSGGRWLTLPLARQPREVPISALRLAPGGQEAWSARLAKVPGVAGLPGLSAPLPELVLPWLEARLGEVCRLLGISTPFRRASTIPIPGPLTGPARIIALAQALGATAYLNLPGGRALYDPAEFAAAGIRLEFLPPYAGPHGLMLESLATRPAAALRADL
ncbi:WbqC family protein [Pseudoroseicyclus sp. CXY001]|uniref:WbqC family protein n=1 Tax=Pseudoroseicyclus sp. CXY001 TaxID=3242492 RepID=UPI003571576C